MKQIMILALVCMFALYAPVIAGDANDTTDDAVKLELLKESDVIESGDDNEGVPVKHLIESGNIPLVDGDSVDFQDRNWIGDRGVNSGKTVTTVRPARP